MKKGLKVILIVIGVMIGIVLLDTLQAKAFDHTPILKIRENLDDESLAYIDKGLFVNHYHCSNYEKVTTWKSVKYTCAVFEQNKKFSDVVQNLNVPNGWHYEEVKNEKGEFELKIYKDSLERYAVFKVSNNPLGVCGTGLTTDVLLLDNGYTADVGSYDGKTWSYISFPFVKYVFILNTSLNEDESNEMLEIIKTIDFF